MWVMEEFSEESQEGEQNVPKGCEVAFYTWGTSQFGLWLKCPIATALWLPCGTAENAETELALMI